MTAKRKAEWTATLEMATLVIAAIWNARGAEEDAEIGECVQQLDDALDAVGGLSAQLEMLQCKDGRSHGSNPS